LYVKIFASLLDSTISELDVTVRWVWVCLLALAEPPDGFIDMTPAAIARRANLSVDDVERAIEALSQPDPMSRTPDEEGRRLVKIRDTYGWQIVNFKKYREMERADSRRDYMRQYMANYREKHDVNPRKQRKQKLAPLADTEAEANTSSAFPEKGGEEGFDVESLFTTRWLSYPDKHGRADALRYFRKSVRGPQDLKRFDQALANYKAELARQKWKNPKEGKTFFNPKTWGEYVECAPAVAGRDDDAPNGRPAVVAL
jgi:hypothetical protein